MDNHRSEETMSQQPTTGAAERAAVLFLTAETPVHAGSGNVEAALDLPIQRSAQTSWPIITDSTLRGAFRRQAEWLADLPDSEVNRELVAKWFGTEPPEDPKAGALSSLDAEILLFPVAAARGVNAWVTCKEALEYFVRKLALFDRRLSEQARQKLRELQEQLGDTRAPGPREALVPEASALTWNQANAVVLETDAYTVGDIRVTGLARWFADNAWPHKGYWAERLAQRFVILHEHAFRHYTLRKTDVRTRVKLEAGVVQTGPWTEENLPVDTVLYTVLAEPEGNGSLLKEFLDAIKIQDEPALQLGGDQSLGRGFVKLRLLGD
jgi:CRISPR-associated protein Cmr4